MKKTPHVLRLYSWLDFANGPKYEFVLGHVESEISCIFIISTETTFAFDKVWSIYLNTIRLKFQNSGIF